MRARLIFALALPLAACAAPPPAGAPRPSDDEDDRPLVLAANPLDAEPPSPLDDDDDDAAGADDDDAATAGDDDDAFIEPLTVCPDPEFPFPETAFADVTACASADGPPAFDLGLVPPVGMAWGDVDGNGHLDLFVVDAGGNRLHRNTGLGHFEEDPADDVLALPGEPTTGASFADYDNDGDPDLYVVAAFAPNHLFRNDGVAGWTDVTGEAGVADPLAHSSGAAWADFDNDGDLDLYLSNYACIGCDPLPPWEDWAQDRLYRNEGDGTFADVSGFLDTDLLHTLGYAAVWFDYDDDGDPDLCVGSDRGHPTEPWEPGAVNNPTPRNLLFRNDGPGCDGWCFAEVGVETGAGGYINTMGFAVGDYDRDGDLDLAVTDTFDLILYRNEGGFFVEVQISAGVSVPDMPWLWGIAWLDYDNDGDLDLVTSGGENPESDGPNYLFANDGDGGFVDVTAGSGLDALGNHRGTTIVDYDGDGWVDVVRTGRARAPELLRNLGGAASDANWLRFRLTGGGPVNGDAVGTRVSVVTSAGDVLVQEVKLGSSLSSNNDPALHFGLGDAHATHAIVAWPDGTSTTVTGIPEREELSLSWSAD